MFLYFHPSLYKFSKIKLWSNGVNIYLHIFIHYFKHVVKFNIGIESLPLNRQRENGLRRRIV